MSDRVIRIVHRIEGVLADLTSAKLRDATNTYGIKRVDTDAVAVAPGTDFVHDGVGAYSYTAVGLVSGVQYEAAVERVYAGEIKRTMFRFTAGQFEDGYYAPEAMIRVIAGSAFDKEFNLNANATTYDPALLSFVQFMTDDMVDSIAYEIGLNPDDSAPDGHYIAPTNQPIYGAIKIWASRWARAQGHLTHGEDAGGDADDEALLGGTDTSGPGSIEGKMTRMRREAEARIRALLKSYYLRSRVANKARHNGIGVGTMGGSCGVYVTRRRYFFFCR